MSPGAFFPAYRQLASALHAAGAGAGAGFCAALGLVFVLFDHPLVLGGGIVAVLVAAAGAGVLGELGRAARIGVGVALLVALLNPLLSSAGDTLLVRGYAVLGHRFDITLEALAYGAVAGVRLLGLILVCALFSAAVDPDEQLRALRRVSHHSALTAALATRLVPVLARDASRRGAAARCRARPASRAVLARAALGGTLERAVEVAAALEVRGYARVGARGSAGGAAAVLRRRSRHGVRIAVSAALLAVAAAGAKAAGIAAFEAYPRLVMPIGAEELALAMLVVGTAAAPFLGVGARMGIGAPGAQAAEGFDG